MSKPQPKWKRHDRTMLFQTLSSLEYIKNFILMEHELKDLALITASIHLVEEKLAEQEIT